ncbi:hypothetical protein HZH68_012091 [Vespula germanica]|uniref:Uncharacterized protein n=1 Tax=Vespula germanica TaxID=30212 RepID=A0A834JL67_VESGE|nr:hypothetical protein HZH68_012091 [Vespula germanica]
MNEKTVEFLRNEAELSYGCDEEEEEDDDDYDDDYDDDDDSDGDEQIDTITREFLLKLERFRRASSSIRSL